MNTCPNCTEDSEYERIAKHWSYSPEHRPELTDLQKEVSTALVMGDGCIDKPGKNALLRVSMINKKYLEHLDNIFAVFGRGVRKTKTPEQAASQSIVQNANKQNYNSVYEFNTTTHPYFNKYCDWYEDNNKIWKNVELTPTILKHLHACDGNFSSSRIVISMSNQKDNKNEVEKCL